MGGPYQTGDLRPVYGRNFADYDRLRHRKRPYAVVYDRRNGRPGNKVQV